MTAPSTGLVRRSRSLDESQKLAQMTAAVGALTWGSQLKAETLYAVARWCQVRDIDPVLELDVLGGKPLPNARWWLRKLGELGGALEYIREDMINADPRLEALAKAGDEEAKTESRRRLRERIKYFAPEEAAAICVVHIKVASMTEEVVGMQFAGGGTGRKIGSGGVIKRGGDADPIGEAFPGESAVTRAYGKAARVLSGFFPKLGKAASAAGDDEGLTEQITRDQARAAEQAPRGIAPVTSDPYAALDAVSHDPETGEVLSPEGQ